MAVLPKNQWVCVSDFGGSMKIGIHRVSPVNQWADWDGEKVLFGGAWADPCCPVPDLPAPDGPPKEEVVEAWAAQHWNAEKWHAAFMEYHRTYP